ncbi:MAG TPA: DUF6319 family protein [Actinomycetota bacterium]|nr:DUF6319 family protein [Actinomycetota bacterium]
MAAAARTAARGLSTSELEHIRDALAGGRRPKVVFTQAAGQIAGQQGQVVELTDPKTSDEWVVVRFGGDELPFSPTDLAIPPRATPAKRAAKAATPAPLPAPVAVKPASPVPTPREESIVTPPASPAKATADLEPADPEAEPKPVEAKAPARKAGRPKAPATLTVTLTYTDGEWMVAAQQGSKTLAKPYVVKPAEALKMVGMLDVPSVHEAVEELVSSARAEAEAAAGKLRAELAEIEARLAELREPS